MLAVARATCSVLAGWRRLRHGAEVVRYDERAVSVRKAQAERQVLDDEAGVRGRRAWTDVTRAVKR